MQGCLTFAISIERCRKDPISIGKEKKLKAQRLNKEKNKWLLTYRQDNF